jgi:hypothetical protein
MKLNQETHHVLTFDFIWHVQSFQFFYYHYYTSYYYFFKLK